MLNRGVVMVTPKQPYLDWAARVDEDGVPPDPAETERTVYLIPSYETEAEAMEILAEIHDELFERELWAWDTESAEWPQDRTFPMFLEWFRVEFHSIVEDLCEYELTDDDLEDDDENDSNELPAN
jgi:hypothetical protein